VAAEGEKSDRPLDIAAHEEMEALIAQTIGGLSGNDIERLRETILTRYY
jgi:hypothetical protein